MASGTLPAQYLKAGKEYLTALQSLGLYPDVLGWGTDLATGEWQLVMLTSIVEVGGPLALNRLLFQAYNMGATPKEISPFIVRVFGDRTIYAPELRRLLEFEKGDKTFTAHDRYTGNVKARGEARSMTKTLGGIRIESDNLYVAQSRRKGHEQRTREWLKFKRNVEKLAA